MLTVYPFTTTTETNVQQVGGKGLSLVLMTRAGLPVPPGFILPVSFFNPWLDILACDSNWNRLQQAEGDELKCLCEKFKSLGLTLSFDAQQADVVRQGLNSLAAAGNNSLFAVRSSSPEEDLAGASFAGGYETILGVKQDDIEAAVKQAFVSCLDQRVFIYKREKGFSSTSPRIAVIIQQQVAAETAGVAFTANPVNNAYDECVINANFGLGESVVAGMVTPDTYVVDKVTGRIILQKIGKKNTAVYLKADGGTVNQTPEKQLSSCLTKIQVCAIVEMAKRVEEYYQNPVDIEWAYRGNELLLLQARYVTTIVPFPQQILTKPGEPKKLYMDFTLVAQGIRQPFSVLGMELFQMMQDVFMTSLLGVDVSGIESGFFGNIEGRSYANISNIMKIPHGGELVIKLGRFDALVKAVVKNIDKKAYLNFKTPRQLKGFLFKAVKNTMQFIKSAREAYAEPEQARKRMIAEMKQLILKLEHAVADKNSSLKELAGNICNWYSEFVRIHSLKLTTASHSMALLGMEKLVNKSDPETRIRLNHLERGLPENITIEMGLAMYRLSRFEEIKECRNESAFIEGLQSGSFSPQFKQAWDDFIENYGFRCPMELDLATPRPYENPGQLFRQLYDMALNEDKQNNAAGVFKQAGEDRERAFRYLLGTLQGYKAEKFKKHYHTWVILGGYREIHKYVLIKLTVGLRKRVLAIADTLVESGRLDSAEQAFDLTFDQLEAALHGTAVDLIKLAAENTAYRRKTAHIRQTPVFFDSRGKIITPPARKGKAGEFIGEPISAGIVKGRVKVLHEPDEKPLLPGEILVARATDPGWTPLFVNAGGIILEVGGMIQHGAVVAREYGKPCIAGIVGVASLFKDGQMIEMDGLSGVIRLLDK